LTKGRARAAVVWPGADWRALGLEAAIEAPRARLAMARLTSTLDPHPTAQGIHPTAIVEGAEIDPTAAIGPFTVIAPGAKIGARCQIGAHVSVAPGAELGADGLVFDGVRIRRNVRIGARATIHCNAVIGDDGFSFVTAEESNVERARASLGEAEAITPADATWHRIHSLGGVVIGDDVEIGSCATIDAGTIRPTTIGNGCKFDNLVQIAHNVVLGDDCLFAGQSAVAGSTRIGNRVVAGGQTGIGDNLVIGDDCVLTGGTKALSNVPSGRVVMGYPGVEMSRHVEMYKALRRLPRLVKRLSGLDKSE
jgi:UDP-3-O-[3-hydroxymyristoyl] glucosamine N-acyltransferase